MKKTELKSVLKPFIKECIKEIIFEEGVLSSIIREAQGATGQVIKEQKEDKPFTKFVKEDPKRNEKLEETRKAMRRAISERMGDFDPFEGTKTLSESQASGGPSSSPMAGTDPADKGVDISNIPGFGNWGAINERLK